MDHQRGEWRGRERREEEEREREERGEGEGASQAARGLCVGRAWSSGAGALVVPVKRTQSCGRSQVRISRLVI